jgi:hypothetical protein
VPQQSAIKVIRNSNEITNNQSAKIDQLQKFTLKKYLQAKEELWKLKMFHHAKI